MSFLLKQTIINSINFRNSTSPEASQGHLEDPADGEQHRHHLRQPGRVCSCENLDLERRQLWVSRLHEDHQLWGSGRDLHGQDSHEYGLPSILE